MELCIYAKISKKCFIMNELLNTYQQDHGTFYSGEPLNKQSIYLWKLCKEKSVLIMQILQ